MLYKLKRCLTFEIHPAWDLPEKLNLLQRQFTKNDKKPDPKNIEPGLIRAILIFRKKGNRHLSGGTARRTKRDRYNSLAVR